MTMSTNARLLALVPLLWLLFIIQPLSAASASADSPTLEMIVSEYHRLKPHILALTTDIRDARKIGQAIESGKFCSSERTSENWSKRSGEYDKDHLRAAKGVKTYPARQKILRLFHVCDAIHRLLDAETKATDFQMLGLKYEETWKQADAALADNQTADQ